MAFLALPAMAATAEFSADPVSGTAPLMVTFTDASTGSTVEQVTNGGFETGDETGWMDADNAWSTLYSTAHTGSYAIRTADTYNKSLSQSVDLTGTTALSFWYVYTDSQGSDGILKVTIDGATVYTGATIPLDTWTQVTIDTSAYSGYHTIAFSETVEGMDVSVDDITATGPGAITAWSWDFDNDGTVDSTLQNPSYEYTAAGTYSVNLTVTDATGSDDEIKTEYITVSPAVSAPVAGFAADVVSGTAPLTVTFVDQSTGDPTSWSWDFGDGSTSTDQSPSHSYTAAGTYTVNLTATNAAGSDDEVKEGYVTVSAASSGSTLADLFSGSTRANIHGADADLTDYQVKFVLYNVTGTDSSENIHIPGIAQPDFNDVRFALSDGTSLSYWKETPAGTDNATFWVKIPSIPAGYANTIPVDIYYGNATIGSAADGYSTFPLFDDFQGSALNTTQWTVASGTGYSVSDSKLQLTGTTKIQSTTKFSQNASIRFRGNLYGYTQYIAFRDNAITTDYAYFRVSSGETETLWTYINSQNSYISPAVWSIDEYRTGELFWNLTYVAVTDGVNPLTEIQGALTATLPAYLASSSSTRTGYYDWVFVRQLADSEPAVNEPASSAATIDLAVTSVSSPTPRIANTITTTIKNMGTGDAGAFRANVTLDGNTTSFDITSLAAGTTTTVSVTDPVTSRVLDDSIPFTVELDPENAVAETDETNNVDSTPLTVVRGGSYASGYYYGGRYYTGYDLETGNYTEGNIAVVSALGSGYQTGGGWYSTTAQWSAESLPIPATATVKAARLYQSYTWSNNDNPGLSLEFNGNTIEQAAFYGDGPIFSPNYNGQAVYDVTPYFSRDGNTAIITASAPSGGLYGALLVVVYEDAGEPYRKIWLDEGCDTLFIPYGTTDTSPYIAYAMFNDVSTTGVSSAKMMTVLPSGNDNNQNTILFNAGSVARTGTGGNDPAFRYYDVTSALQSGTNELGITNDGSYVNLAAAILEATYEAPPEVAFTADITSGTAPVTVTFTDSSYGATSCQWDFGDGSTSTDQNPAYTYTTAGTYTVSLTATNTYGSSTETKTDYIAVTAGTGSPAADFSTSATNDLAPVSASFTDASTNTPTSWLWEYRLADTGAWTQFSTEQNPSFTATTAGTYDIRLTATNAVGSDTETKYHVFAAATEYDYLTTIQSGTVSGDLYVDSVSPWGDMGGSTYTQSYTLPVSGSNIAWARVFVNDYSGSGTTNYPVLLTTEFDADGDGTFETVLGTETCDILSGMNGYAYPLNDHVTKVYSDYEAWYDVTSLLTSTTPKVRVTAANVPGETLYDGRIKGITLVVAYNDGDADQVKYWVNHGNDWTMESSSTGFDTSALTSGWTSAEIRDVAFSSIDASYTLNGNSVTPAQIATGSYYKYNSFDVTGSLLSGAANTFGYSNSGASFKACLATLAVKYAGTTAPVAEFSADTTSGTAPLTVTFTDASTNSPTSWFWDFGDGSTSTDQSPSHEYTTAGTYTVTLTATNAAGSDDETKTDYITVSTYQDPPVADFSVVQDAGGQMPHGLPPLSVSFTDASTGTVDSYVWEYSNEYAGIPWTEFSSGAQNPTGISFTEPGTYGIRLTVTNSGGSSSKTIDHAFVVGMAHDYLTTIASGTVSGDLYTDSRGPWADTTVTYSYSLPASGDNIVWARVFVNDYSGSGTTNYPVLLTTELDANGDGTFETVLGSENCDIQSDTNQVAYPLNDHVMKVYSDYEAWYDVTSLLTTTTPQIRVTATGFDGRLKGITLMVAYNDGDSDQVQYIVNHGNDWMSDSSSTAFDASAFTSGWTDAEIRSISFSSDEASYTLNGDSVAATRLVSGGYYEYNSFDVTNTLVPEATNTLGFTNAGVSFKICLATLTADYSGGATAPVVSFTADPTTGVAPLTVQFIDSTTGTYPMSWSWDFGDGSTSTEQNPSHEYTSDGTYTVTLTATNSAGSDSETKTDYITVTSTLIPDAAFSAIPVSGLAPLTIQFTDESTNNPTSWSWDFGDGSTSTGQNPGHEYSSIGSYTVTLTATNSAGSDSEIKTDYITASQSAGGLGDTAWPKFHYDLNNTGQSPYSGPQTPNVVWTYTTTGEMRLGQGAVTGSDGTLYNGDRSGNLYAINPDGTLKWKISLGTSMLMTPAIGSDGTIFTGGYDKVFYAINPDDGSIRWSYSVGSTIISSATIGSDGTIYFATGSALYALKPDGAVKWTYAISYGGYNYFAPAIGPDGTIYLGTSNGVLAAINADGTLKWTYSVTGANMAFYDTPAIGSDGTIYIGCNNANLYAVNPDGTLKWTYSVGSSSSQAVRTSPAIGSDGTIYFGSNNKNFYAMNPDGTLKWSISNMGDFRQTSPTLGSDGTIYTDNYGSKTLYAINPDGSIKWSYTDSSYNYASPVIASDGTLYYGKGYTIYAFRDAVPVADFSAGTTSGTAPLTVTFTDASTNTPTGWAWDFGDGSTSADQNPVHEYTAAGTYTVTLTVTNVMGSDDETKTDYITVTNPTISFVPSSQTVMPGGSETYEIVIDPIPNGLAGYDLYVTLADGSVADITGVSYPSWAQMTMSPTVPADTVRIGGVDSGQLVYPGSAGPVTLATVTVRGTAAGTSSIVLSGLQMDDDYGNAIDATLETGEITVRSSSVPVADFTATPTTGASPLAVTFSDASTTSYGTITDWYWEFGDGTTSTEQNPAHTYQVGIYTVKLTVTAPGGTDTETKTSYIVSGDVAPEADFTATPTAGLYPMTVTFSDASAGNVSTYYWNFGDGTYSALRNPVHIYTYPGTFTVSLTVSGPGGSDTETRTDYIDTSVAVPDADFIATPTSGLNPLHVRFSDRSTGNLTGVTYAWDFDNDGTVDSTDQNPDHTYTADGLYAVSLTIMTDNGADTETKTNYIDVGGNMAVDFTGDPTSGVASRKVPLYVTFTDATSGSPTAWTWDFGNGNTTGSAEQNPITTYWGRPAEYTVTLTASSGSDTGSLTRNGYIAVTPHLDYFPIYNSTHAVTGYMANLPADLNGDYVYEDINGNGRVDYNDVVTFYNAILGTEYWVQDVTLADFENFDYSGNGAIGYNDVVALNDLVIYS